MRDLGRWHRLHPDLWTTSVELSVLGAEAGRRGVAVRYAPGRWAFVGPVPLDPALRAELDAEGAVVALVQATAFHNSFVAEACEAFPGARVFTARGAKKDRLPAERLGHLPGDLPRELTAALTPIPVEGMRAGHEVAFVHATSRTLIVADLLMHFPDRAPTFWTGLFRRTFGWAPGPRMPKLMRWMLKDRTAVAASLDRMLEHPIERIVVSHGETIEADARAVLENVRVSLSA